MMMSDKVQLLVKIPRPAHSTFLLLAQRHWVSLPVLFLKSPRAPPLFPAHIQSSPGSYLSPSHLYHHMIPLTEMHGIKMLLLDESFH